MRKDPPFDMEYVYTTHMLEYAELQGARVFNRGDAIRNHPEKLAITEVPEFTTPTLVTRDMARIKAFRDLTETSSLNLWMAWVVQAYSDYLRMNPT